uniref:Uncharacterized protein n=1 Tax=Anolis carolinensis TaxID=28377 RepID=H9GC33_ANOCA
MKSSDIVSVSFLSYQEGNRYFSQGEWEKAITCFTKALNLDPTKLYEQKAEAFLQLCDFKSAMMHLRKAYSLSSRKESVIARLAFVSHLQVNPIACLAAMKRFNDCLQMVNEEVAQEKNADLFVLRARLYEHFGKVTLCFHNLQDALALEPNHAEAQVMMSNLKKEAQRSRDQAATKAVKANLKAALVKINRAIDYNPVEASYFLFRYEGFWDLLPDVSPASVANGIFQRLCC